MTGPPAASFPSQARDEFVIRRLVKPEEFRAAEELLGEAYGPYGEPALPSPLQRALQDNGGLVLGAFSDIYLAGVTAGFLGWDGTSLYHYAAAIAVRPEYQNHRVGFRLKSAERDELVRQGLGLARWTIDPLESRNAYLSVRRLGAQPDQYLTHHYGQLGPAESRSHESDRIRVTWTLESPRVGDRLARKGPLPAEDARRLGGSVAVVETAPGESGIRLPVTVTEPAAPQVHIEIPFDFDLVRQHEPASIRIWRHALRDAFRAALDAGYSVDDFAVVSSEHERRAFYFLSAPDPVVGFPPAISPAPGPSAP